MSLIDSLPFVHAAGDGGPRSLTQMIVIHATDNATASAQDEASYASWREDQVSAHIYVDGDSAVRALPLDNVAYGCYPMGNARSVQFELCGRSNFISDATMRRAAPFVAEVCQRYGLPIRKVSSTDLVNGVKGICGHGDVTNAWHQGDHTDPGSAFPWSTFIEYVAAAARGDDVSVQTDNIIGAWAVGLEHGAGGETVAPVTWRIRDEVWQASVNQALAELKAKAGGELVLTPEAETRIIDGVTAKLAPFIPTPEQIAKAVLDEEAARLANG